MQRKQMEPVDVNGGVHTARKQHQRICVRICVRGLVKLFHLRLFQVECTPEMMIEVEEESPFQDKQVSLEFDPECFDHRSVSSASKAESKPSRNTGESNNTKQSELYC